MKLPSVPLKAGRGIKAELRRSLTRLRLASDEAVHLAIQPCSPAESGTGYSGEGE